MSDDFSFLKPLQEEQIYQLEIALDDIAHHVPAGHKLRLSISNTYWPLIWPSPEDVRVDLSLANCSLSLPAPDEDRLQCQFDTAESATPADILDHREASTKRRHGYDTSSGEAWFHIEDDFGCHTFIDHGLTVGSGYTEEYRIRPNDSLSARVVISWFQELSRNDWCVRTESDYRQTCDKDHFYVDATVRGYEDGEKVFDKCWKRVIKRESV